MKSGNLNCWNPLGHSRPVTDCFTYTTSSIEEHDSKYRNVSNVTAFQNQLFLKDTASVFFGSDISVKQLLPGTFLLFFRGFLLKVKNLKCTLVQARRLCTGRTAHTGSRDIALLFLDHGTRRG
jgi:hypothetical protein